MREILEGIKILSKEFPELVILFIGFMCLGLYALYNLI